MPIFRVEVLISMNMKLYRKMAQQNGNRERDRKELTSTATADSSGCYRWTFL